MIKEKQKERKQKAKEIVWFIQNNINSTEKCINFADDYIKKARQDGIKDCINIINKERINVNYQNKPSDSIDYILLKLKELKNDE